VRVGSNPVDFVRDRLSAACTPWEWFSRSCGLVADSSGTWRLGCVLVSFRFAVDSSPALLGSQLVDQQLSLAHVAFISGPRLSLFYVGYHLLNLPEHWRGDALQALPRRRTMLMKAPSKRLPTIALWTRKGLSSFGFGGTSIKIHSSVPGRIDGIDLEAIGGWEQP